MPFCVLMEAALQPCGWLASYVGSRSSDEDLLFRNLDGKGTLLADVLTPDRGDAPHRGDAHRTSRKNAGMIIENFEVECCAVGDDPVYALEDGVRLLPARPRSRTRSVCRPRPSSARCRAAATTPSTSRPGPRDLCAGLARLADPMLLMLDRVTGSARRAAVKGLGPLRAEKDVDAGEWFFKAHFFQDPVQPGSLGIEAMIQLLQFFMLESGMHEGLERRASSPSRRQEADLEVPRPGRPREQGHLDCTLEVTATGATSAALTRWRRVALGRRQAHLRREGPRDAPRARR
jgi:3-hydroxymyristoyl/3-hydroxydecanoyl-(acyl carrier protein) dehydratase